MKLVDISPDPKDNLNNEPEVLLETTNERTHNINPIETESNVQPPSYQQPVTSKKGADHSYSTPSELAKTSDEPVTHPIDSFADKELTLLPADTSITPVALRSKVFDMIKYCTSRGIDISTPSIGEVIQRYPNLDSNQDIEIIDKNGNELLHLGANSLINAFNQLVQKIKPAIPANIGTAKLNVSRNRGTWIASIISIITFICLMFASSIMQNYIDKTMGPQQLLSQSAALEVERHFDDFKRSLRQSNIILSIPVEAKLNNISELIIDAPVDFQSEQVQLLTDDLRSSFAKQQEKNSASAANEFDLLLSALRSSLKAMIQQRQLSDVDDTTTNIVVTPFHLVLFALIGAGLKLLMEIRPYLRDRNFDAAHTSSYVLRYLSGTLSGIVITLLPSEVLNVSASIPMYFLAIVGGFGGGLITRILQSFIDGLESIVGQSPNERVKQALMKQKLEFTSLLASTLNNENISQKTKNDLRKILEERSN
ncbi:MAG: hypothetical protein WA981_01940 [Glaciecola sp.]